MRGRRVGLQGFLEPIDAGEPSLLEIPTVSGGAIGSMGENIEKQEFAEYGESLTQGPVHYTEIGTGGDAQKMFPFWSSGNIIVMPMVVLFSITRSSAHALGVTSPASP